MRSSSPLIANAVTATTGMALSSGSPLSHLVTSRPETSGRIGTVLAGEIERLHAVARADGMVAVSLQQVVEELHVELIVLHNHHGLRHRRPSVKRRAISATAGLAVISLGSVRASHIKKGLWPIGSGR